MTSPGHAAGAQSLRVRVTVPPPPPAAYDVVVQPGVLDELPARAAAAAPAAAYVVIVPESLVSLYGARALERMRAAGLPTELLAFPDGEANKTRASWAELTDRMLELKLGRDSCVIAVGGGVTGDVAGFVAATYMRGVPVVQVPTTLLAMIDASVGGKTGVDTAAGKNLVGSFHSPRLVLIDPLVLRTLPAVHLRSGMAEAVKHGAILDAVYFSWIDENASALLAADPEVMAALVSRSIELKADIVAEDPFEHDRRAVLNFGHTVGHALERAHDYALPHGFAVAAGMIAEAAIGEAAGITEHGAAARIAAVVRRLEMDADARAPAAELLESMRVDKKARRAEPRFVLLERIGSCAPTARGGWTHAVSEDVVAAVLNQPLRESSLV